MRVSAGGLALSVIIGVGGSAAPAFACFEHTFEACPARAKADYVVALDKKTGRTWLKAPPAEPAAPRIGRLPGTDPPGPCTPQLALPLQGDHVARRLD